MELTIGHTLCQAQTAGGPGRASDLLGECIWACYDFAASDFDPETRVRDEVQLKDIPAGEVFTKQGTQWIMNDDSLPADPAIKALAANKRVIMLETAPVDAGEVHGLIQDCELPIQAESIDSQGRVLWRVKKGSRRVVAYTDVHRKLAGPDEHKELAPRMIWRIPWKRLAEEAMQQIVHFMDLIYSAYAFSMKGLEGFSTAPQTQELRQTMELQMQLQIEQRPILCLQGRPETQMQLLPGLQMLMAFQRQLLALESEHELAQYLAAYEDKYGTTALNKMIIFCLAGQVKHAVEASGGQVSWKEARNKAWEIAREHGAVV